MSLPRSSMTRLLPDLVVGEIAENVVSMYVHELEDNDSEIVTTMVEKTRFTVLDVGDRPTRIMISAGEITGWISTKTDQDQPLTVKIKDAPRAVLGETVTKLQVRVEEDPKSEILVTIDIGTRFEVIEEGDQHRCKILVEGVVGWIPSKTDLDQPLIRYLSTEPGGKANKAVDTVLIRVASTVGAKMSKLLSSKSGAGGGQSRGMASQRSERGRVGVVGSQRQAEAGTAATKYNSMPQEGESCCTRLWGSRGL